MIEQAIYKLLSTAPDVTAIVKTRIYGNVAPQGKPLPYITYTRIDADHYHHMGGMSGLANMRIQVDCWSGMYPQVKWLAEKVRLALDAFSGDVGSHDVRSILLESDNDLHVTPFRGDDNGVHRQSMDFMVVATETTA